MFKLAANLTHLWTELPFLDRFGAAAAAGFEAVEVLSPYDVAVKDTRRAALSAGVDVILINGPPPNYTGGARGFAAVAGLESRFRRDLSRSLRYARELHVCYLHLLAGMHQDASRDIMVENLRWAVRAIPDGLTLTLEPLCDESLPGYFLNDYVLAASIIEEVGSDRLGLQYDSYHAQEIHGDAVAVFRQYRGLIRHVQIGDAPGRVVPGSGAIDFVGLFAAFRESGYDGWVSAEYTPGPRTEEVLDWMKLAQG